MEDSTVLSVHISQGPAGKALEAAQKGYSELTSEISNISFLCLGVDCSDHAWAKVEKRPPLPEIRMKYVLFQYSARVQVELVRV